MSMNTFNASTSSYKRSKIFSQIRVQYHIYRHANQSIGNHEITSNCPRWSNVPVAKCGANNKCEKYCMIEGPLIRVYEVILSVVSDRFVAVGGKAIEYVFLYVNIIG